MFIKYVSPILRLQHSVFSRLIAYADDLLLIKPIQRDSGCDELNADFEKIFQQYELLKLSINPIKRKYLLCTAARPHLGQVLTVEPEINGTPIARVSTMKYLGVTFDHQLSFTDHALQVSSRTRKAILRFGDLSDDGLGVKRFRTFFQGQSFRFSCMAYL